MNIELRSPREKAGMSQAQLAVILGLSQAQISRYEQEPGSIPIELLLRWVQALGTDIAILTANAVPPPPLLDAGTPYAQIHLDLNLLEQYIDAAPSSELDIPNKPPSPPDLKKKLEDYRQKPNLVLVGRFDSGKSRLANTLMGQEILPSQYQPATRLITFALHIDDRPFWLKDQVLILEDAFWTKDEKGNPIYDLSLLKSHERCQKYCIKSGSLEILHTYGLHNHLSEEEIGGHSAIVYVDPPILKACNIVDFPGYSDKAEQVSEDVKKAGSAVQIADLVLYTSPANGFVDASDHRHISHLLKMLKTPEAGCTNFPTLGNLFIVATHAAPHISNEEIESLLKIGAARLYREIDRTIEQRSEMIGRCIDLEDLQKRFFAFWAETPSRWANLKDELIAVLGHHFPKAHRYQVDREISELKYVAPRRIAQQIEAYEQTFTEVQQRKQELEQLEKAEPFRQDEAKKHRRKIHQWFATFDKASKAEFQVEYERLVDISAIENIIRKRYDKRDDAKKYAAGYLLEQLQGSLQDITKEKAELLKEEIIEFLGFYEVSLLKLPKLSPDSVHISIPFDPTGSFIGGMAGTVTVGALAAWASTLGNLGAYIIVAKGVSLLSALGISLGGVAPVVALVAAIGGPLTLGIGLIAAATLVGVFFQGPWQRRLSKKIIKFFENKKVLKQFLNGIDEYWQDTDKAFGKGADAVEEEFKAYISHLRELCADSTQSREAIEKILSTLRERKDFFTEIPWNFEGDRE